MKLHFLIAAMLITVPAFAGKALIANCSEGGGCTFELSDFESDLFENDFGRSVAPDDIIVLGKKKNGDVISYLDKSSREEIDRDWGGDGYTQIGLFNPYLQPISGTWQVAYGASVGNDCYGIGNVGAFIRKIITPGKTGSAAMEFPYPFNPAQLFPSHEMRWVKTGYNTYKGLLDFNSSKSAGMRMYYNITIVSRKKIESHYTIEIKVPTKETCRGKVPVTFTLLKEAEAPWQSEAAEEDDLLPVNPKGNDDLLPVNPKKDDLLPIKPGQNNKPDVPRIEDKPNVPRLEDRPKPNIPLLEDKPKPNVPRIDD
ncbi:MAG: hypothetical protein JNM21_17225 [Taibaiella sp.]|nr:hypothetical protein [Taibaiella sp.]